MILTLPTDKLTPRTADEFLVEFLDYAHGAVPGQPLEVDLRPLHFIDPYGLVALCLLARYGTRSRRGSFFTCLTPLHCGPIWDGCGLPRP